MKKLLAFTLAETLIVIGIIGVVSALTLPNLNSSTGEKEKVAKVKKIYRDLNDAFGRAVAIYGPIDEWIINDNSLQAQVTRYGERITEFMKVSKNCGYVQNGTNCFTNVIKSITSGNTTVANCYEFILADGTAIALDTSNVFVDIDGYQKGNNKYGHDVFKFNIFDNTIGPWQVSIGTLLGDLKYGSGSMFSTWVINYDNMDYLKLNSSGDCPNGKTPTESNPRCN